MTDDRGQFKMSGPFSGTLTVLASKDGYLSLTQNTQVTSGPTGALSLVFRLDPTGPSVDITGEYNLTLIADARCTALPAVARSRTYKLAIAPNTQSPLLYTGVLSGATFYRQTNFQLGQNWRQRQHRLALHRRLWGRTYRGRGGPPTSRFGQPYMRT